MTYSFEYQITGKNHDDWFTELGRLDVGPAVLHQELMVTMDTPDGTGTEATPIRCMGQPQGKSMSKDKPAGEFRRLHESPELFVMPNPWDIGTVKIFSQCGFKALATTSGGMAYSLGKRDGFATRADALRHCSELVNATDLPLSADLENGYGDSPEEVADMITAVAATGVAGCSIEDFTGNPESAIFDRNLAIERIQAAHEARLSLADDFVLTARCEKFIWNEPDLDVVIERLQAFEKAGADVLFAPGIEELGDIKSVVTALEKPVSVLMSTPGLPYGLPELQAIGVSRVSIGSSMAQLVYGKAIKAISELAQSGTFNFLNEAMDYEELENWFINHS